MNEKHMIADKISRLVGGGTTTLDMWRRRAEITETEIAELRKAASASNDRICQTLGKALGYPWFKDDQVNFPGATEEHGVCVGDHVSESIAEEAAKRIKALEEALRECAATSAI